MGLPSLNLVKPSDLASLSATICAFEVTYSDNVNQLVASSLKVEVDTIDTFDSASKITSESINVSHNSTYRMAVILSEGTWYWRVTATNTSGTTVSPVRSLSVSQVLKRYPFILCRASQSLVCGQTRGFLVSTKILRS